jgi:hypothetical protein
MVPALEEIGDGIVANIRRRQIWSKGGGETLKKGLWSGPVQPSRTTPEIDMGWSGEGAAFGPGHEWGFKKSSWMVKPKNVRTSTTWASAGRSGGKYQVGGNIGQPIKALRFVMGGKVFYSKGHRVRAPRVLKKHWQPAYDAYPVGKRMELALDRAADRVGLSESQKSRVSVGSFFARRG